MSETLAGIWIVVVLVVMLNGCAVGVVAWLHTSRRTMRRGAKIAISVFVTALLPASLFFPFVVADLTPTGGEEPIIIAVALAMVFVLSAAAALPGAYIMSRKVEAPGDEYRTFE